MNIREKLEKNAGKIFVGGALLATFSGGVLTERMGNSKEPVETFIADDGKQGVKVPSDLEVPVAGVLGGTAAVAAGLFGWFLRKENEEKRKTASKMHDVTGRNR